MMNDPTKKADRAEIFADQIRLNLNPNGCLLLFQRTNPFDPPILDAENNSVMAYEEVANVRVTPAHLKQMVYLMWKTILEQAKDIPGGVINVPKPVLDGMGVDLDQWAAFYNEPSMAEVKDAPANPQPVPVVGQPEGSAAPAAPIQPIISGTPTTGLGTPT